MQFERVSDIHFGLAERISAQTFKSGEKINYSAVLGNVCMIEGFFGLLMEMHENHYSFGLTGLFLAAISYGVLVNTLDNRSKSKQSKAVAEINNSFQSEIIELNP